MEETPPEQDSGSDSDSDSKEDAPLQARQEQDACFLRIGNVPIYFKQDWAAGIGGGLWSTGLAMAQYLATNRDHAAQQMHRLSAAAAAASSVDKDDDNNHNGSCINILELGSGNGLLAACWLALAVDCHCPVRNLVVTDTAEHLPLIRQTLNANPHLIVQTGGTIQKGRQVQVHVLEHQWGVFQEPENNHKMNGTAETDHNDNKTMQQRLAVGQGCDFDLIVGSDVAYHPTLYRPLIASLKQFSNPNRTVILLGCTMSDTTPEFFVLLRNAGFRYQRLADHLLPVDYRGSTMFGIFVVQQ